MLIDSRFYGFLGIVALLTITPGADMALVTRSALRSGLRPALTTTVGIISGIFVWAAASAVGIASLYAASSAAFTVVKLAGAAYLFWLGAQTLWHAYRRAAVPRVEGAVPVSGRSAYRQGLMTNLLNPKIAVFYATFLPQFISPGDPVFLKSMLLAGVHNALGLIWLTSYAYVVTRAGDLLRRPRPKRYLDTLTGLSFVGLGVRLALERR